MLITGKKTPGKQTSIFRVSQKYELTGSDGRHRMKPKKRGSDTLTGFISLTPNISDFIR